MLLLSLLACIVAAVGVLWFKYTSTKIFGPLQPPEMAAAQFAARDVVGDLGGIPVTIPRHFANYVEYEGDPGWGEKRKGPRPERTHASRLISFGFKVRFPDMAGLSSPALEADKLQQTIYNTTWIRVGVITGNIYPGDGFLDRRSTYIINEPGRQFLYEMLPHVQNDLTVYVPAGIDPQTKLPYREHRNAEDIFLHRDKTGRVDAYISCSNLPHEAAPCKHSFSMEPYMKAQIHVSYRRGLLPEWQQIQNSVTQLIMGFKTTEPASETNKR
jgi:hypothetical protein